MGAFDVKTAMDIGLGAVSLLLFFQQSRILRELRIIVTDHGRRITRLERRRKPR